MDTQLLLLLHHRRDGLVVVVVEFELAFHFLPDDILTDKYFLHLVAPSSAFDCLLMETIGLNKKMMGSFVFGFFIPRKQSLKTKNIQKR